MPKKKKSAFTFKELLFAYLAISKAMYWMNNFAAIQQDAIGEVWRMVLDRLLTQDIMIIWILLVMFLLEHYIETHPAISKGMAKHMLIYSIGYVFYTLSIVGHTLMLGLFFYVEISSWAEFVFGYSVFYVVACVVLTLKERMKKKEAEMYIPTEKINEDTLILLNTLRERGVLSQDEYESKKSEL
jgi:hypothetical protein